MKLCHQRRWGVICGVLWNQQVVAPPGGGFLFVGDDVLLSHCQIAAFDLFKVWFQRAVVPKRESLAAFVDEMAEKVPRSPCI